MIDKKEGTPASATPDTTTLAQTCQCLESSMLQAQSEVRATFERLFNALKARERQLLRQIDVAHNQQLAHIQSRVNDPLLQQIPRLTLQMDTEEVVNEAITSLGAVGLQGASLVMNGESPFLQTIEDYQDASHDHMSMFKPVPLSNQSSNQEAVIRFNHIILPKNLGKHFDKRDETPNNEAEVIRRMESDKEGSSTEESTHGENLEPSQKTEVDSRTESDNENSSTEASTRGVNLESSQKTKVIRRTESDKESGSTKESTQENVEPSQKTEVDSRTESDTENSSIEASTRGVNLKSSQKTEIDSRTESDNENGTTEVSNCEVNILPIKEAKVTSTTKSDNEKGSTEVSTCEINIQLNEEAKVTSKAEAENGNSPTEGSINGGNLQPSKETEVTSRMESDNEDLDINNIAVVEKIEHPAQVKHWLKQLSVETETEPSDGEPKILVE